MTAVFGEQMRSTLVVISSYPPASVAVGGGPAYDGLAAMMQAMPVEQAGQSLSFAAAVRMPQVQWAIKLHPSEGEERWRERLGDYGLEGRMKIYRGHLNELLCACDVVVSWYSTVILEAALRNRPVVSMNTLGCLAPVG